MPPRRRGEQGTINNQQSTIHNYPLHQLLKPEDFDKQSGRSWNRISRYIRDNYMTRTQLFQWEKALEGILTLQEQFPSLPVNIEMGESKNHNQSPRVMSSFV